MGERLSDECSLESVICGCRRSYDKIRALVRELSVRREEWLLTQIVQNTVYKCLRFVDESFPIPVHISGSWIHMSARGIRDFHAVWCRGLADVYQPRNYETKVWWEIKGGWTYVYQKFLPCTKHFDGWLIPAHPRSAEVKCTARVVGVLDDGEGVVAITLVGESGVEGEETRGEDARNLFLGPWRGDIEKPAGHILWRRRISQ